MGSKRMKPSMRARFKTLLMTKSEVEFFFTLAGSMYGDLTRTYDETHGFGMNLAIRQNLPYMVNGDGPVWTRKTSHSFSLFMDGTLTWTMLDQPTITGLKPIQEALECFRDQFNQATLPAYT